jgi:hypothetical protein
MPVLAARCLLLCSSSQAWPSWQALAALIISFAATGLSEAWLYRPVVAADPHVVGATLVARPGVLLHIGVGALCALVTMAVLRVYDATQILATWRLVRGGKPAGKAL